MSWYLAVDWQLFLFVPFFAVLAHRYGHGIGALALLATIAASWLVVGISAGPLQSYQEILSTVRNPGGTSSEMYYKTPWGRAPAYIGGALVALGWRWWASVGPSEGTETIKRRKRAISSGRGVGGDGSGSGGSDDNNNDFDSLKSEKEEAEGQETVSSSSSSSSASASASPSSSSSSPSSPSSVACKALSLPHRGGALPGWMLAPLWIASVALLFIGLYFGWFQYGGQAWDDTLYLPSAWNEGQSIAWTLFQRPAFIVGLAILSFLCFNSQAGAVAAVLEFPLFTTLGRLVFGACELGLGGAWEGCVKGGGGGREMGRREWMGNERETKRATHVTQPYRVAPTDLAHPLILYTRTFNAVGRNYFTAAGFAMDTVANVCVAFGVALVFFVMVEKPCANLQAALEHRLGMR